MKVVHRPSECELTAGVLTQGKSVGSMVDVAPCTDLMAKRFKPGEGDLLHVHYTSCMEAKQKKPQCDLDVTYHIKSYIIVLSLVLAGQKQVLNLVDAA